jgi:PAS domain S-box-containing protein
MKLSSNTSINELLEAYPFLVDFLVVYNPRFGLLKNKVMRATIGKMATLKQVAGIGEVSLDTLIKDIAAEIESHTGEGAEFETEGKDASSPSDEKIAKLKEIILDLHQGVPFEEVKKRFDELIADVEPTEIAAMEEQLIKEGMPAKEVQRLADLHVSVFKEALDVKDIPDAPAGHPVHTFMEENKVFTNAVGDMDLLLQQLQIDGTLEKLSELEQPLQEALDRLSRVEIHYQRKENQLFPFLEKHGITGPPQVMWGRHDDIRAQLKQTKEAFESQDLEAFLEKGKACTQAIGDMIYKENYILFPLSLESLDESEWIDIRKGESDIGYAFAEPAVDWPRATDDSEASADADKAEKDADQLDLDTGRMTADQVNLMLKHLPVDMTFVDENDQVRYFSAGKERIFPRSRGIIGRNVQKCHPPKSLDVVNRLVGEFKAGTKDEAAFWIQVRGRLIYIRYFAVRDDEGAFRGTLEVSQDITDIKSIEGERRLLNWDVE